MTTTEVPSGEHPVDELLLLQAAEEGNLHAVQQLLEQYEIDPNQTRGRDHWSALHAASFWGHVEIVRLLLSKGAKADVKDRHGRTPLFGASCYGHDSIVKLLLQHGADPNASIRISGNTALDAAYYNGHATNVKLLLQAGVETNVLEHALDCWPEQQQNDLKVECGEAIRTFLDQHKDKNDDSAASDRKGRHGRARSLGGMSFLMQRLCSCDEDTDDTISSTCAVCEARSLHRRILKKASDSGSDDPRESDRESRSELPPEVTLEEQQGSIIDRPINLVNALFADLEGGQTQDTAPVIESYLEHVIHDARFDVKES